MTSYTDERVEIGSTNYDIDVKATANKVKALLGNYDVIRSVSVRELQQMSARGQERKQTTSIEIEQNCREAIQSLQDNRSREILSLRYLHRHKHLAVSIELHIPERSYYRQFEQACVEFAEIYRLQNLLVMR